MQIAIQVRNCLDALGKEGCQCRWSWVRWFECLGTKNSAICWVLKPHVLNVVSSNLNLPIKFQARVHWVRHRKHNTSVSCKLDLRCVFLKRPTVIRHRVNGHATGDLL